MTTCPTCALCPIPTNLTGRAYDCEHPCGHVVRVYLPKEEK